MDRAVIHAQRDHAAADTVLHDQIDREVFDEEISVVLQALLIERVEHGMAGAVGRGAGALDRRSFAHVLHVPAKGPLIDRAIGVAAERHAGVLQFIDRGRCFTHHIFDRVLIAQPVRTLDGIEHVPGPVIGRIVLEACRDPALRGNGVAAGGEDLGDAGGFQPRLGAAHCCAQARTTSADHHGVESVVDDLVSGGHAAAPRAMRTMAKRQAAPPANAARLSKAMQANLLACSWT